MSLDLIGDLENASSALHCSRKLSFFLEQQPRNTELCHAGGGAVEAALSIFLETFATTLDSREQLAIAEFANALLIIPKTLAVNAAKDATDLIAKLRAYHYTAQNKKEKQHLAKYGLDLLQGSIRDNVAAGVLEPVLAKTKIIQV